MSASRFAHVGRDFLASIVVFLVALPLCMGIAIASGAPVSAGLVTGIVAGLVVGTISGCPLQVSGPAAGLTVIVYECIQTHGLENLGLIVLMAGGLQLAAAVLRMGQWFRAVSPAVIQGMLAGIGALILCSQFHVMLDDEPKGSGLKNLLTIPSAIGKAAHQAALPAPDARRAQKELLQALGEVHREQVQINESILERLPHHRGTPDAAELDFTPFAERQAAAAARLEEILLPAEVFYAETPRKLALFRERHAEATAAMQAALVALTEGRAAEVPETLANVRAALEHLQGALKHHELAAAIGVLTIVVLIFWKPLAPRRLTVIPPPLVGVIVATAAAAAWSLPILYVEVPDNILDEIHLPTASLLSDAPWSGLFWSAVLLAIVASAETLLCATAVDQLHDGPRTNYDRELFSQGVGNTICGLLGVLPMTGVIVRSGANVQAGAKTRLSAILHGVWLLLFVAAFSSVLRMVPTACLAGILVYTGYKLINWRSILKLRQYGWGEVGIYVATVVMIVATDLLTGVLVGVGLAVAKLLYTFSHLESTVEFHPEDGSATLRLRGAATFMRLPQLAAELERIPRGTDFHVDLEHLDYIDHACLDLLMNWSRQHEATGGSTTVDWDRLQLTARNGRTPPAPHRTRPRMSGQQAAQLAPPPH
jgi:MFS superfamily sulfate permease-like transporter